MLSRTSRILLVVAVIAGAAWLLLGRASRHDSEEPARLAEFDARTVDAVVVRREGETLRFARADSAWRITEPVSDGAEPSSVLSLLDALEHANIARDLGRPRDLAPFGLDAPPLHITLLAGADTLLDASFGNRTVDDAWMYARAPDRDLVLVPTNIARAATQPVNTYRNQRVVDFRLRDVTGYRLVHHPDATEWRRGSRGWYTVVDGDTVPGDSVAVEAVLRRLRGLRVGAFAPPGADTTGLETTITLWTTTGTTVLRLGRAGTTWRADNSTARRTVFIDDDIGDLVAHTTTDLRERRLLQFPPADAARIQIALPSVSGELVRVAGHWAFPNPAMGRVDAGRAADLVRALRSLKWDDPSATPAPVDARLSILIRDGRGGILDEVSFRAPVTGTRWVARSRSDGVTRGIDGAKLDHLAALFRQLRSPSGPP